VLRLLVTADVPSSPILVTLMMAAMLYATWHIIPEDGILQS
jgi:hypothetical protein